MRNERSIDFIHALLVTCALLLTACTPPSALQTWDGKRPTAVDAASLLGLIVQPETVILPMGHSTQLSAIGLDYHRERVDLTHMVEWMARDHDVATVSSDLDVEGVLYAVSPGTTYVKAKWSDLDAEPIRVDVTDAEIERLTVSPDDVQLTVGETVALTAFGQFSDSASGDLSAQVRWTTDAPDVARIDASGRLEAAGAGRARIWASWGDQESEPIAVEVVAPETIAPADLSLTAVSGRIEDGQAIVTATLVNRGERSATDFFVEAFADPRFTPEVGDIGQAWDWVDYLGPGRSTTVELSFITSDDEHEVVILVDSNDAVAESDEGDNTFSTTITETAPAPTGPDLVVDGMVTWTEWDTLYYEVEVTNTGTDSAGWFFLDVWVDQPNAPAIDDDGDMYTTVSHVPAGSTSVVRFSTPVPSCSPCASWVLADSYDSVVEHDETNNVLGPQTVWP